MRLPPFGLVLAPEPRASRPSTQGCARRRSAQDGRTQCPRVLQLPAGGVTAGEDEVDHIEQLPVSDWEDQDLLTKNEARQRLFDEIGRCRAQLDELKNANADDAEVSLLARRLNAMESVHREYDNYLDGK